MDKLDGLWVDIREELTERRGNDVPIESEQDFRTRVQCLLENLGPFNQDCRRDRRQLIGWAALVIQAIEDFNLVRPL